MSKLDCWLTLAHTLRPLLRDLYCDGGGLTTENTEGTERELCSGERHEFDIIQSTELTKSSHFVAVEYNSQLRIRCAATHIL